MPGPLSWLLAASLLAAALVGLGLGCGSGPEPVRIGLLAGMSGEQFRDGQRAVAGARFAVRQINDRGGLRVDGELRPVELLVRDTRFDPAVALAEAERLAATGVSALVGPLYSASALSASQAALRARVPMITPTATAAELGSNPYVFQVSLTDEEQAAKLGAYAFARGARRAAVLRQADTVYGRNLAEGFAAAFREQGGAVVLDESFPADERSFDAALARVKAAGADLLLLPNRTKQVILQVNAARRAGFQGLIMGGDSWDGPEVARNRAFEGTLFVDQWWPGMPGKTAEAFEEAFRTTMREEPTEIGALSYDAVALVCAAVELAGSSEPEKVREALAALPPFPGVTGRIEFGPQGQPLKDVAVVQVVGGGERVVTVLEGATP